MWEPSNLIEKKFNEETHRLVGEEKLHEFGDFVEEYTRLININQNHFTSNCNINVKPIFINEEAHEGVSILHLSHSDNSTFSRILSTLGGLCQEIEYLKKDAENLYPSFLFYGEEIGKNTDNLEWISDILESLQKTQNLIQRAKNVIVLTVRQLSGILNKGYYISSSIASFSEVLSLFADLLICLLKYDVLFDDQILKNHWVLYRRSLRNILHKSLKLGFEVDELRAFSNTLTDLETSLLSGTILKDSIEGCLDTKLIGDIKKSSLNIEFHNFLSNRISELEKDEDNILYTDSCVQVNVLVAFYFNIFGNPDKKFTKRLLDLNKKISVCTLIGNILWYPEQFLLKHVQSVVKLIDEKSIESYRLSQINAKVQNLPKETNMLCSQACNFLMELESKMKINATTLKVRQLKDINQLLLDSLKFTKKINGIIKWIMNIHVGRSLPVTKTILTCISRLIEILKDIYASFQRNMLFLSYFLLLITQHLQHTALCHLDGLKKNLTQSKSYKDMQLDILSALKVCENALKGPNTKWRLLVANLALSASGLASITEIRAVLNQLMMVSKFTYYIKEFCDCSVLYWHFSYVMPVYFSKLVATKSNLSKCYPLLSALTDCENIGGRQISNEASEIFKEKLCGPLNQIVETNLRLQTHLHLQLPPSDPFQNYFSLNFNKLLPMPLNSVYKSIRNDTEHYLSVTFYNLTTVVLHDWKTYGEMRRLATLQYGLHTVDDDLPMQTLDQGLDVLEIMRNINVFVQKYLYNLNTQIFIEESSTNKYLNSINISHVANSIRTHGIGIMNTTVNYTYQFLKNKFTIFSQFLFDEQIKSRLLKDIRYFGEHKNEFNQMYPYERAELFNNALRSMGTPEMDGSYLDLFRKVITHIGNALGYVRLVRSGGNRCLAEGTCFIPDLTQIDFLSELSETETLSDMSNKALTVLLQDCKNLTENFENTTEYFKLLVKAFVTHFRHPKNMHLRNFYVIVPPLTINFVEHSLTCKERLYKKKKTHSAFTDDGFALGLAYIIELLDQESQLSSLHWFESVQRRLNSEAQKIQQNTFNPENTRLKQTYLLTERKINSYLREFKLLEYSFSSARLFFQT